MAGEFLMQFYLRNNVFKNNIVYVGEHGKAMTSKSGRMDGVPSVIMDHNLYSFPAGPKPTNWSVQWPAPACNAPVSSSSTSPA